MPLNKTMNSSRTLKQMKRMKAENDQDITVKCNAPLQSYTQTPLIKVKLPEAKGREMIKWTL